jgi:carbon monoxide dehydrogenase subunit G
MRPLVPFRLAAAALLCAAAAACAPVPRTVAAPPAAPAQPAPMQLGDAPILHEEVVELDDRRYVGGTAYVLIDATPEQVLVLLEPAECYWHVLPRVWDVKDLGIQGPHRLVELEQGTDWFRGRYTVRVHTERAPGHRYTIRFSLDKTRPHAIDDAYGSFGIEPYGAGKTLVTWKVRIDLGHGVVRWLFEEKVRKLSLAPPVMVRGYVDDHIERARAQLAE